MNFCVFLNGIFRVDVRNDFEFTSASAFHTSLKSDSGKFLGICSYEVSPKYTHFNVNEKNNFPSL
jgi:hypothetical protein